MYCKKSLQCLKFLFITIVSMRIFAPICSLFLSTEIQDISRDKSNVAGNHTTQHSVLIFTQTCSNIGLIWLRVKACINSALNIYLFIYNDRLNILKPFFLSQRDEFLHLTSTYNLFEVSLQATFWLGPLHIYNILLYK